MKTYYEREHHKDLDISDEVYRDLRFIDCTFEDCKFQSMTIDNCEFLDCEFINCNIVSLTSETSDVKSATIKKSNLIGVNWSELISDQYSYASPIYKMNETFLKYNTFSMLNLSKVDFKQNTFDECLFDQCELNDSKFNDSVFTNSQITNSNLERSDFKGAKDYYIDLKTNKIKDARFSYPEVTNLLNSLDITID